VESRRNGPLLSMRYDDDDDVRTPGVLLPKAVLGVGEEGGRRLPPWESGGITPENF